MVHTRLVAHPERQQMTESVIFGHVDNVKAYPSTGQARIEISVPVEFYPQVVQALWDGDVIVSLASPDLRAALGRYGVHTAAADPEHPETGENGNSGNSGNPVSPSECGPLCKWAGMVCKEPTFWEYLGVECEDAAVSLFRHECGVGSRRELDDNPEASGRAHKIRHDYMAWKSNQTGPGGW